jgi:hypothetical protein
MTSGELDLRELVTFVTAFEAKVDDVKPLVRRGRASAKQ